MVLFCMSEHWDFTKQERYLIRWNHLGSMHLKRVRMFSKIVQKRVVEGVVLEKSLCAQSMSTFFLLFRPRATCISVPQKVTASHLCHLIHFPMRKTLVLRILVSGTRTALTRVAPVDISATADRRKSELLSSFPIFSCFKFRRPDFWLPNS